MIEHSSAGVWRYRATSERTGLGFRSCSSLAAVHARTIEIPFQSASALEAPPRVNVGQFVGAGAVAPAASARSRSQWCRLHRPGLVVVALPIREFRRARPNPNTVQIRSTGVG